MESLSLPCDQNYPKSSLRIRLRADIWMYILDFICDISLFSEIPKINKFFYRLSQSYPNFKTSLYFLANTSIITGFPNSPRIMSKNIFIHQKVQNLLLTSHNLNSVTFNISDPIKNISRYDIELMELKPYIKRVNLIVKRYLQEDFNIMLMSEAIEININCPSFNFNIIKSIIENCKNLRTIRIKSNSLNFFGCSTFYSFRNITELDFSCRIYDCPCFDWHASQILQNTIEGKVLKLFKGNSEFFRFTNELISMMKEIPTLKIMKFKGFSVCEPKIHFITDFLNPAAQSSLVSISITTPIRSFLNRSSRNIEYKQFLDAIDNLLKNCLTLKHFRLTSINRLSYSDVKRLAFIVVESIKSDWLESFNKLDIKGLKEDKLKTFYIKYNTQADNKNMDYLYFLILSEFIPKSNTLEKIVIYKHQTTEININATITNMKSEGSFTFNQVNLCNLILLIIASKLNFITTLSLNTTTEIYNETAIKCILSSSNQNHITLSLHGDKNSKTIFSIVKTNPFIFSKLQTLKIDLKNEILTHSTFSNLLISETLTSINLKNFTVCISETFQNNKSFTCLQELKIINALFSQNSFDFIVDVIKNSGNLEIIILEKCCVKHKKGTSLEAMQEINIKNSDAIIDSLLLKTKLKKVFIKINKNLDRKGKSGFENVRGIERILENNKGIGKFDLILPFSDDGLLEFIKLVFL